MPKKPTKKPSKTKKKPVDKISTMLSVVISNLPKEHRKLSEKISSLTTDSSLAGLKKLSGPELVDSYLAFLSNCTLESLSVYRTHILQFFEAVGTDDVKKINGEIIADYINFIQEQKYAKDTMKLKIGRVMAFLKFCEDLRLLTFPLNLIAHLIKPPRQQNHALGAKDVFDQADVTKLKTHFSKRFSEAREKKTKRNMVSAWRDLLVFTIGLNTGIRVSEIANIRIGDIYDYEGKWLIRILGKGSKKFEVPLNHRDLEKIIKPYLRQTQRSMDDMKSYLIQSERSKDKPVSRVTIFKIIKKTCLAAGIRKSLSPHSLRHTYATNLALKDADIYTIKEALHHESISTSERYIHIAEQLKDKIRQYSLDGFGL